MDTASEAVRRLGLRHPIIQGPFGGGMSTVALTAAVSNLGGLGSYGAHVHTADDVARVGREIKAKTNGAFALNLWVSDHDPGGLDVSEATFERYWRVFEPYFRELGVPKPERPERYHNRFEDQVEALIAAEPAVFSFVFGIPRPAILAECRRRGIVTVGAATTVAEAEALEAAGVDMIVATGFEAGGHRPAFLGRAEDQLMGTLALVPAVADRVQAPVIAAGGIADGRGARAALALGADLVQVGTAFLACEESGTTDEHRALLLSGPQQTLLTRAFTGRLARGVPNRWTDEMAKVSELPPFPAQSWFLAKMRPAAVKAGLTDFVSLWAGQASPSLRHKTAAALMDALVGEMD